MLQKVCRIKADSPSGVRSGHSWAVRLRAISPLPSGACFEEVQCKEHPLHGCNCPACAPIGRLARRQGTRNPAQVRMRPGEISHECYFTVTRVFLQSCGVQVTTAGEIKGEQSGDFVPVLALDCR